MALIEKSDGRGSEAMTGSGKSGFTGLYAQALGAMAPPYNCIVVGAVVVAFAGHRAPAAFLLAGIGMLFYGVTVVALAEDLRSSGGLYVTVRRMLGPRAGLWFGGALVLNGIFTIPATIVSAAMLLETIAGAVAPDSPFAHSWLLWVCVLTPLSFFITLLGSEVSGRIVLAIVASGMSAILLLDFMILHRLGIAAVSWTSLLPTAVPGDHTGLAMATGVAVVALAGAESSLFMSAASRKPAQHIPLAIFGSIGAAALFYVLTAVAFSAALPLSALADVWGKGGPSVLGLLGETYLGRGFALVAMMLVAAAAIAGVISFTNYVSRVMMAMSVDVSLPRCLQSLNRYQTPWTAVMALGACACGVFTIGFLLLGDTPAGAQIMVSWLYFAVTLFLISNYVLICLSAVLHGRKSRKSGFLTYFAPGIALCAMLLGTAAELVPIPPHPYDQATWTGLALLLGLVLYGEIMVRAGRARRQCLDLTGLH